MGNEDTIGGDTVDLDAPIPDTPADTPFDTPIGDSPEGEDVSDEDLASNDEGDVCVPACDERSCGDDGCGALCGLCGEGEECREGLCEDLFSGLPEVHNLGGAPVQRVRELIGEAIASLGFDGPDGPQIEDRFVVGNHYLAWIDETGFYGKMNGLWWLEGEAENLDFAGRDTLGRPVSLFIVGEDGRGRWPEGYPGAEHIEFPSRIPEPDDDPDCANRDWCNQYGLNEANDITDPDIPWWSSCNTDLRMSWTDAVEPIEISRLDGGGLRLVYEGRLVKIADGDGQWDGDQCFADWLFEDQVRRPVYLRVGYELHPDEPWFDRVMQFRNPENNPSFEGPLSLIGGFVISDWPNPHYMKAVHRFVRPIQRDIEDPYEDQVLTANEWTPRSSEPIGHDQIFAWLGQPFNLSGVDEFITGWTARMSHLGASDNDDTGFCLCEVHGGLELGGGLIHGGISLPIGAGEMSTEARRRLQFGGPLWRPISRRVYQAESDLNHGVGRQEGDGWAASTTDDAAGHMVFGPYATDWGDGPLQVVFDLMVDNNTSDDFEVVNLDIFDATTNEVLASRPVHRDEFLGTFVYQDFDVEVDLRGRANHSMESRVFWRDISYVRVDKVTVFGVN
jgi:hypothetical protein